MATTWVEQRSDTFSLTRMIYVVFAATLLYRVLEFASWSWVTSAQTLSWDRNNTGLYFSKLAFVFSTVLASLRYRPFRELYHWPLEAQSVTDNVLRHVGLGFAGGIAALAVASPIFLVGGDKRLAVFAMLFVHSYTLQHLFLMVLLIGAVAYTSEILFRGVVFRTLMAHASLPASVLASCSLFALTFPALDFAAAAILGAACAVLFYKTRHLLSAVIANAVFVLGGGVIIVSHGMMRG